MNLVHSHYSLLRSISKPAQIIERAIDLELKSFVLADINNINGYIPLLKAKKKYIENCKDDKKRKTAEQLKIYLGTQLTTEKNTLDLVARNLDGYKSLIKLVSESSRRLLSIKDITSIAIADSIICLNNKKITINESFYPSAKQAKDQWILLCSGAKTTIPKVKKTLDENEEIAKFFRSNQYEIRAEEEEHGCREIEEKIEPFDVFSKPIIPKFNCPDGILSEEYLKKLCREGWKEKIQGKIEKDKIPIYADRIKHELEVLQGAGLSDYFLILADIAKFAKDSGHFCGPSRGSAAGCLTAYLAGITAIDPIPYGLIFERFYNAGRNTKDRVSFPDIDFDIQASFKDELIEYIKNKYGHDNVAQIGTFGRLMGRGMLKEVLRIHEACSFAEINSITKDIPDEAAIADDLNEMQEEEGESGIIKWSLENMEDKLRDYCYIDKEGKYQGQYGKYFEQAVRLEGVIKSEGKHAAGLLIWPTKLEDNFPIRYDKNGQKTISYGMNEIEACGGVKLDILGISILDKIKDAQDSIRGGWNA